MTLFGGTSYICRSARSAMGACCPRHAISLHTTPEDAGETVSRLMSAIDKALDEGFVAPKPGSAKQRLRERAEQRVA